MPDLKYGPNIKPYQRILYSDFIQFLYDTFGMKFPIKIRKIKTKKNVAGSIDLGSALAGKNEITLSSDLGVHMVFAMIAHEATHLHQVARGDLGYNQDTRMVTWKGKDYISVSDLNKMGYGKEYMSLPWEVEAWKNQKTLGRAYTDSNRIMELKGQDKLLDMIIASGGL